MNKTLLDGLVETLDKELAADPRGARVASLLETYARRRAECWREFAQFLPDCYARNAVQCCDDYELIVICWQEGQVSPIHDHDGQRCWMSVLDGTIRETLFDRPAEGPLVARSTRLLQQGQVAFITDDIALHEIRSEDGPAVSLHLYAKPIRNCRVFCPDTGRIDTKRLSYHTAAPAR